MRTAYYVFLVGGILLVESTHSALAYKLEFSLSIPLRGSAESRQRSDEARWLSRFKCPHKEREEYDRNESRPNVNTVRSRRCRQTQLLVSQPTAAVGVVLGRVGLEPKRTEGGPRPTRRIHQDFKRSPTSKPRGGYLSKQPVSVRQ